VEVRRAALGYVERHRPRGAADAVSRRLEDEPSAPVRAAALRCLCALQGPEGGKYLTIFLGHRSESLRRAATIGLLESGIAEAEEAVGALVRSAAPNER